MGATKDSLCHLIGEKFFRQTARLKTDTFLMCFQVDIQSGRNVVLEYSTNSQNMLHYIINVFYSGVVPIFVPVPSA